jgi:hypothetical protein
MNTAEVRRRFAEAVVENTLDTEVEANTAFDLWYSSEFDRPLCACEHEAVSP